MTEQTKLTKAQQEAILLGLREKRRKAGPQKDKEKELPMTEFDELRRKLPKRPDGTVDLDMLRATSDRRKPSPAEKEARKLRKALKGLTEDVRKALKAIDATMRMPESRERGERVAQIANALEIRNDIVRRYELGIKDF